MSSLYAKLIQVIEQKITPMAGAVGQQKYVTSIRDGFITALPFMIVGSFMLVFIFPPFSPDTSWGFARAWLQFSLDHREALMLPFNFSMGIMTIFISVGIAASLAKHHDLDRREIKRHAIHRRRRRTERHRSDRSQIGQREAQPDVA